MPGKDTSLYEFPLSTKSGDWLDILLNANPRRDAMGQIIGVVGVGQDITEKRRAMEAEVDLSKATAANDAKSQFLATMSHEMRTPLNGVIGINQLLMSTNLDSEQKELCNLVSSSADTLLHVINDILDLTRVESGKLELDLHAFDLSVTVDAVLDTIIVPASEKGLEIIMFLAVLLPSPQPDCSLFQPSLMPLRLLRMHTETPLMQLL